MRFLSVIKPAFAALTAMVAMTFIAMQSAHAASVTYNFDRITSNANISIGSQLSMVVEETTVGNLSGALFTFYNNVGIKSSITDIYFDDMTPAIFNNIISYSDSGVGVSFDNSAKPKNLPGGKSIGFKADHSGDSNSTSTESGVTTNGVVKNGVNSASEWVSFLGYWAKDSSFAGLISALNSGDFRVGLHIQSIGTSGKSDSYVNELSPVPLPAAAWLFGSALFGFVMVSNRRKV